MKKHFIESVKDYKKEINKTSYTDNPKMSVIVLSFNHFNNIENTFEKLNNNKDIDEIIICEDGSIDESLDKWISLLNERKHIIIKTHDFNEIRAYDRAIRYSRGKIVCLLQDDDNILDDNWVKNALDLFNKYPKLGILGGASAPTKKYNPDFVGQSCVKPFKFKDDTLNIPFMFACSVNKAPYFINKKLYEKIGGFDYYFSEPGNCGNQEEIDLCYRMWLKNYQVGLYKSNFDRSPIWSKKTEGQQGSVIFNNYYKQKKKLLKSKDRLYGNNLIEHKYKKNFKDVSSKVNKLNSNLKTIIK